MNPENAIHNFYDEFWNAYARVQLLRTRLEKWNGEETANSQELLKDEIINNFFPWIIHLPTLCLLKFSHRELGKNR